LTGSEKENLWHYKCSRRSRIDRENFKESYTVEVNIIICLLLWSFFIRVLIYMIHVVFYAQGMWWTWTTRTGKPN